MTCARTQLHNEKALQSLKIKEIGDALVNAGLIALDEQARSLGLCRSTAWTILIGRHKASGLSAAIINQMLSCPELPPQVRARLLEYIDDKIAGRYGHGKEQIHDFCTRIRIEPCGPSLPRRTQGHNAQTPGATAKQQSALPLQLYKRA